MMRPCFGCKVFDEGPRHTVADEVTGETLGEMHLDCCAEHNGCQLCQVQLQRARAHAGEDLKDEALGALLESLPPLQVEHVTGAPHGEVETRG